MPAKNMCHCSLSETNSLHLKTDAGILFGASIYRPIFRGETGSVIVFVATKMEPIQLKETRDAYVGFEFCL